MDFCNYTPLATNQLQTYFEMYELAQIMTQKEDKLFAELLIRLREGKHSEADIDILKQRLVSSMSKNQCTLTTHFFATNALVNLYNDAIFQMSTNQKARIPAIDVLVGDVSEQIKQKMKERIRKEATKTMGLYAFVLVTMSTKYDLTSNVSVLDGMTNGTECSVCKIDYRVTGFDRPSIIWLLFSDSSVRKQCCKEYQKSIKLITYIQIFLR